MEQRSAGLLTDPACFGAYTTVVMHAGVAFAFFCADAARFGTGQ